MGDSKRDDDPTNDDGDGRGFLYGGSEFGPWENASGNGAWAAAAVVAAPAPPPEEYKFKKLITPELAALMDEGGPAAARAHLMAEDAEDALAAARYREEYERGVRQARSLMARCPVDDYQARAYATGGVGNSFDYQHGMMRTNNISVGMALREELRHEFAYAIPCPGALKMIARYAPILEIGAGSGYWAYMLRKLGVDVLAYDKRPGSPFDKRAWNNKRWTGVLRGRASKAKKFPGRALMLCWPPLDFHQGYGIFSKNADGSTDYKHPPVYRPRPRTAQDRLSDDALRMYTGKHLIYIGESGGGCTGSDAFHNMVDKEWEEIESMTLPQWYGIHDCLYIYRRK